MIVFKFNLNLLWMKLVLGLIHASNSLISCGESLRGLLMTAKKKKKNLQLNMQPSSKELGNTAQLRKVSYGLAVHSRFLNFEW